MSRAPGFTLSVQCTRSIARRRTRCRGPFSRPSGPPRLPGPRAGDRCRWPPWPEARQASSATAQPASPICTKLDHDRQPVEPPEGPAVSAVGGRVDPAHQVLSRVDRRQEDRAEQRPRPCPRTGIATSARDRRGRSPRGSNGERCRAAGDGPCPSATCANSTGAKPKLKKTIPPKSVAVARRAIRLHERRSSRPAAPSSGSGRGWLAAGCRTCAGLGRSTLGRAAQFLDVAADLVPFLGVLGLAIAARRGGLLRGLRPWPCRHGRHRGCGRIARDRRDAWLSPPGSGCPGRAGPADGRRAVSIAHRAGIRVPPAAQAQAGMPKARSRGGTSSRKDRIEKTEWAPSASAAALRPMGRPSGVSRMRS